MSVPRTRGRPSKEDAVRLHADLLEIATTEFLARGYAATSIEGISARSKISKMTIYRHFPQKENLFRAVVTRINEQFQNDFVRIAKERGSPREVLKSFAMASYDDPASERVIAITRIIIGEANNFPDLAYSIYKQRRAMMRPLADYITRMTEAGIFRKVEAELAAFQFVAMASGGIRVLMVPRDGLDRNRDMWVNATVDLFLDGILVGEQADAEPGEKKAPRKRSKPAPKPDKAIKA
ncbi:TetR/AcrR family transcriptional regulator [Sphingopyxis flava]|uniref:Transcriptional regulator, TetR family n=1 Tax=Sphingopyxis flava TaxID=1507287 RepID=A0A1T5FLM9_9SPHN|nr:TetR/AcrR family transcriptional regulator [Sphingopyxis flava]SKB97079.1 transcriptional regulator, TetR family [Sphingopyxis flava]